MAKQAMFVKLTPTERAERESALAELDLQVVRLDREKRQWMDEHKEVRKPIEAQRLEICQELESGQRWVDPQIGMRVLGVAHVLRHVLFRELGIAAEWAPQSSARKLLLGKLPSKGRKEIVRRVVDSLHSFEDGDQADAFVAANWGLSELGQLAFVGAEAAA